MYLECDHFGFIPFDPEVRQSLKTPEPFLLKLPDSRAAETINRIALGILRYWNQPIEGSTELLRRYAETVLGEQSNKEDTDIIPLIDIRTLLSRILRFWQLEKRADAISLLL